MPLQHPLGVGEAARLLGVRRRGQEEHLGLDVFGAHLPGLDLGAVLPPGRALDHRHVPDDQPVEVGHAEPLHAGVGRADGRVLAEQEVAFASPVQLLQHGHVGAVVAGQPGQVVEAEAVLRRRGRAPVRLEQADHVGPGVGPESLGHGDVADVGVQVLVLARVRHRQVAGQQVEQGGDVGRALDGRVAAQGQDAAARAAHVAQQGLQDRGGADVLHAHGVLGPADAVNHRGGAVPAGVRGEQLADPRERLRRHAAGLLDDLRGVPREVALEDLEDAARVLEGLGHLRRAGGGGAVTTSR